MHVCIYECSINILRDGVRVAQKGKRKHNRIRAEETNVMETSKHGKHNILAWNDTTLTGDGAGNKRNNEAQSPENPYVHEQSTGDKQEVQGKKSV
jgi:hypothetical protein